MPPAGGPIPPLFESLKTVGGAVGVRASGETLAALAAALGAAPEPPDVHPRAQGEEPANAMFRLPEPAVLLPPGPIRLQPQHVNYETMRTSWPTAGSAKPQAPLGTILIEDREPQTIANKDGGPKDAKGGNQVVFGGRVPAASLEYSSSRTGSGIDGLVFCEPEQDGADGDDPCQRYKEDLKILGDSSATAEEKARARKNLANAFGTICSNAVMDFLLDRPSEYWLTDATIRSVIRDGARRSEDPCKWLRMVWREWYYEIGARMSRKQFGGRTRYSDGSALPVLWNESRWLTAVLQESVDRNCYEWDADLLGHVKVLLDDANEMTGTTDADRNARAWKDFTEIAETIASGAKSRK